MHWKFLALISLLAFGCDQSKDADPPKTPAQKTKLTPKAKAEAQKGPTPQKVAKAPAEPAKTPAEPAKAPAEPIKTAAPLPKAEVPALFQHIPVDHLVGVIGAEGLDELVVEFDRVFAFMPKKTQIDAPPVIRDPKARTALLGFDVRTPEGWREMGIDPAAGFAVILDDRLPDGPVVYLKVLDREKLLSALRKARPVELTETKDGASVMEIDDEKGLLVERDGLAIIYKDNQGTKNLDTARKLLAARPSGKMLSDHKQAVDAFRGIGGGSRVFGYVDSKRGAELLKAKGQPLKYVDFYTGRFKAMALAFGPKGGGFRLLTSAEGVVALRKVLQPAGAPTVFSTQISAAGMTVGKFSLNLKEMFRGVGELIPPSESRAKASVLIGENMIPVALGVQIADLAAALSGHFAVAVETKGVSKPAPPLVTMLGVRDPAKVDAVLKTLVEKFKEKMPIKVSKVGALDGYSVTQNGMELVAARSGKLLYIGLRDQVEEAIKGPASPLAGQAAAAIDGAGIFAFTTDVRAYKDMPMPTDTPNLVELLEPYTLGDQMVTAIEIDSLGLVAQDHWKGGAVLPGMVAAIAIPAFIKYINKSKASLARLMVVQLKTSAMTVLINDQGPLIAAPLTPAKSACDLGVKMIPMNASDWAHPGWKKVRFTAGDQPYQYELITDGKAFTARAIGDLDCDGVKSTFEITDTKPLRVINETE